VNRAHDIVNRVQNFGLRTHPPSTRVQNPPIFFEAVERFSRKNFERSGAVERKFQKISIFFCVFHEFFANYCSKGTKTLTNYSSRSSTVLRHIFEKYKMQHPLCFQNFKWSGAERWSGVSKNRWSGVGAVRSAPSAQIPLHRSTDFEP
jgi:hypothetical protein